MKKSRHRQLMGTIFTTGSVQVAEMISQAGFDWVMIDMEHSTLTLQEVQNTLPAFGDRILKIVRVPGNDEIWIKRVLDTGCDGIMAPMIKTGEEAAKLVMAAKYPPEGQRSVGVTRAHGYGQSFGSYVENANRDLIIMAQVEHIDGVRNIDSILSVSGIDAIFIGPYDLSASMGLAGQVMNNGVKKSIGLIKKKCRDAGKPYGIFGSDPGILQEEIKEGCNYVLCGIDIALFSAALKDLSAELHRK